MSKGHEIVVLKQTVANDTTASTDVVIGPVDVSQFEKMAVTISNSATAVSIMAITMQGTAQDLTTSASDTAVPWFDCPTASYPYAGSAAPLEIVQSPGFDNYLKYLRFATQVSSTGVNGLQVTLTGWRRF